MAANVHPGAPTDEAVRAVVLAVLVADDNEVNRIYMQSALELLGHRCVLVEDSEEAVRTRCASRPSISCCWTCTCRAWTALPPRGAIRALDDYRARTRAIVA